jgi:hypothetical protein
MADSFPSGLEPLLDHVSIIVMLLIGVTIVIEIMLAFARRRKKPSAGLAALLYSLAVSLVLTFTTFLLANAVFNLLVALAFWAAPITLYVYMNPLVSKRHVKVKFGYALHWRVRFCLYVFTSFTAACLATSALWLLAGGELVWSLNSYSSYFSKVAEYYNADFFTRITKGAPFYVAAIFLASIGRKPIIATAATVLVLAVGLAFSFLSLQDALRAREIYRLPRQYDPFAASKYGEVLLGHEFKHWIIKEDVYIKPVGREEHVARERIGKRVEEKVGRDGPFYIDLARETNPHVVITGASGSGKTETVKALTGRYWTALRLPSLFLDWTGEYSDFVNHLGGRTWICPDNFKVNPFMLYSLRPSQRSAQLSEALAYATDMTPLQAMEVQKCALELYQRFQILEENPNTYTRQPPTVQHLIKLLQEKLDTGQYGKQEQTWVPWIIRKCEEVVGIFGEEPSDFWKTVYNMPTCIDLSHLPTEREKAVVSYTVLQRIHEKMKELSELRLFVVMDEAWQVLTVKTVEGETREPLPTRIVRLGRKYGYGIIVGTQMISDISEAILSNASSAIVHRFWEPRQLSYMKRYVALSSSQTHNLRAIPAGAGYVMQSSRDRAALIQVQMFSQSEFPGSTKPSAAAFQYKPILSHLKGFLEYANDLIRSRRPHDHAAKIDRADESALRTTCPACGRESFKGLGICVYCGSSLKAAPKPEGHVTPTSPPEEECLVEWFRKETEKLEAQLPKMSAPQPEHAATPESIAAPPAVTEGPFEPEPLEVDEPEKPTLEMEMLRRFLAQPPYVFSLSEISEAFLKVPRKQLYAMLKILIEKKNVRKENAPNLEGRATPYYSSALDRLESAPGLLHRAMQKQIEGYVRSLGLRMECNMPNELFAKIPDVSVTGLFAIEVETGLKRLGRLTKEVVAEMRDRNDRLGMRQTIIVVPDEKVFRTYRKATDLPGVIVTPMSKLKQVLAQLLKLKVADNEKRPTG